MSPAELLEFGTTLIKGLCMKYLKIVSGLVACITSSIAISAEWTKPVSVENIIWRPGYYGFYSDNATFHDPQG